MRALITGINGHIGSRLARVLLQSGWDVAGLVRKTSNVRSVTELDIELYYGDIADKASVRSALRNADACFHLAAPTMIRSIQDSEAVIIGTKHLCASVAESTSVRRMVYVSTSNTMGVVRSPDKTHDETQRMQLGGTPYRAMKWEIETAVCDFIKKHDADIVIVNPSSVIGPGDARPTPTGQLIVDFLNYAGSWLWLKRFYLKAAPVWFDAGFSTVDVDDVARGIYLAFLDGKKGERYILGGDNITMRELYLALSAMTGLPPQRFYIPKPAMLALAWMLTKLMTHPPMSYALAKTTVGVYSFFTAQKAVRELGYVWRPHTQSLFRAVEWFLETPLIREERKPRIREALARYKSGNGS